MHHVEALGLIQRVIAESVVPAGLARIRALPLTDEQLALDIMNALDEQGLRIVKVRKVAGAKTPPGKPG